MGLKTKANLPVSMEDVEPQPITQPPAQPSSPMSPNILPSRTRSVCMLSDQSMDGEAVVALGFANVDETGAEPQKDDQSLADDMNDEELEDWEADLDESV